MISFMYRNRAVQIAPELRKKKTVYWVRISGRPIDFLSNPESAKRFAVNFIDVIDSDEYLESNKYYSKNQNNKRAGAH
jgi:hypothetical protein